MYIRIQSPHVNHQSGEILRQTPECPGIMSDQDTKKGSFDPLAGERRKFRGRAPGRDKHRRGNRARTADEAAAASLGRIYGLHAAEFALRNAERRIDRIRATENAERKLSDAIAARGLPVERVTPKDLDKQLGPDTVHQGVLLEVGPPAPLDLPALIGRAVSSGLPLVLLDQVTDPQNVGAVLRSAAVFGAAGLVLTHRHSPPLGATLAKAASGALDLVPVSLVQNLAKAMAEIRDTGFDLVGLDGDGDQLIEDCLTDIDPRQVALVLGAEGKGMRELTRQSCSKLARIGGDGPIASLNVSNAAAVALHAAATQRRRRI